MNAVEHIRQVMLALPLSKELRAIARYYQALGIWRQGQIDEARRRLERVTAESTTYRARALLTIGATYFGQGKAEAALPFYLAVGQAAGERDLLTFAESQKMIAVVRSIHGDHKQALEDIEKLFPLVRTIGKHYPPLYYDFLNSLAVELGEVGRLDEAEAACRIVLASPFAKAYPGWVETRDEIAAKRAAATPPVVAINITPEPAPAPQVQLARQAKPVCALALICFAPSNRFLQTSVAIALAMPLVESIQRIFNQMRFCIQPRGPPCRF
jgi:tetratricopeptide (TPR) repeat protein